MLSSLCAAVSAVLTVARLRVVAMTLLVWVLGMSAFLARRTPWVGVAS